MKKLGVLFKETSHSRITGSLKESGAFFIIKYAGVSGLDLSTLRRNLKNSKASFFVVKNSIARRALKSSGYESLVDNVDGPCGLVFIKEDPVVTSKILCDFRKAHEKFLLQVGFLKDKVLETKDIESMARLPSREILRAQVVMTLNAPISGLVMALHQVIRKFVYCLDQIREKKATLSPQEAVKKEYAEEPKQEPVQTPKKDEPVQPPEDIKENPKESKPEQEGGK